MARQQSIVMKQHPIVMIRNLLILQIAWYAIFVGAGAAADYGTIYSGLPFTQLLSYQLAYFLIVALAELVITIAIFAEWLFTHLEIRPELVIFSRGAIFRRKTVIPIDRVASATASYGLFGKLLQFGKLTVKAISGEEMSLGFVPRPQRYAEIIMRFRAGNHSEVPAFTPLENPEELIAQGENERVEFKSTMRWDMNAGQINRSLEKTTLKTVAAFLNSKGGQLVIGVDDKQNVLGMEHDFKTLTKQNADGFENHFTHVFNSVIGAEFREFVQLRFAKVNGKDVCVVSVAPASRPVFAKFENSEEFYVRTGNSTTPLKISEATAYISRSKKRFS